MALGSVAHDVPRPNIGVVVARAHLTQQLEQHHWGDRGSGVRQPLQFAHHAFDIVSRAKAGC
eukprot:10474728-Lingulodinium_polyedra.AAC.1